MGGRKSRKHFKVDTFPEEVKEAINAQLVAGHTYDDIVEAVQNMGHNISRSGIHRYGKDYLAQFERIKIVNEQAKVIVSEVGTGLEMEEATSKIITQKVMDMLISLDELPANTKNISGLLSAFAKLQSSSVLRERLKKEIKAKADEAVKSVEEMGRTRELSPEAIKIIKEQIYGIVG